MKLLRWILWEKSHLENEIGKVRADLYLHSQRINLVEAIGRDIMQEFDNIKTQIARVQTAQANLKARIDAMPVPAAPDNIAPAEMQAVADDISAVVDQLNAMVPDTVGSTGGISG